jgi:hypothetical protein
VAASAQAGVVLSDNFNSDGQVLNWPGDAVFTSTSPAGNAPGPASTDLIGPGFYPLCAAGQGNCVDLDGSTGSGNLPEAGQLDSNTIFGPGTYTLTFDLAGNQRGAPAQTTVISLGTWSTSLTENASDPWATYTFTFTTTTGGALQFADLGPSNQQGNLLDNVLLSYVPEPATWAMLLAGLGMLGAGLRLRRRTVEALA